MFTCSGRQTRAVFSRANIHALSRTFVNLPFGRDSFLRTVAFSIAKMFADICRRLQTLVVTVFSPRQRVSASNALRFPLVQIKLGVNTNKVYACLFVTEI